MVKVPVTEAVAFSDKLTVTKSNIAVQPVKVQTIYRKIR